MEPGEFMEPGREKNPPLDHASARIVSELAARLLPPLREALSEVRSQEDGDRDAAWREIREAISEMCSREDGKQDAVWREIREAVSGLGARTNGGSEESAERWEALSRSLGEVSRGLSSMEKQIEAFGDLQRTHAPDTPNGEKETQPAPDREAPLSELMGNRIPAWEGLLRAHNQAQSQELNALSTELAELQNETRNALIQTLREVLSQERTARGAQWDRCMDALREDLRREMHRVQRWLWGTFGLGALALLLLLALLAQS